jgi:hypothetical protein
MEVRSYMRTNGFIFIALGLTAVTLAGTPDYLPNVGPVGLRFAPATKPSDAVTLPPLPAPQTATESPTTHLESAEIPTVEPKPEPPSKALPQNPPVIVLQAQTGSPTNAVGPLIGPQMETNNAVTPQMFLRFFTPNQNGQSREAIIVAPPGFSPAPPPAPSSTATYTQPKS